MVKFCEIEAESIEHRGCQDDDQAEQCILNGQHLTEVMAGVKN